MKKVTIDPITRLEGHGKIEIFLTTPGGRQRLLPDPRAARLRALLRRPPGRGAAAHHAAHLRRLPRGAPHGSAKAIDAVYGVDAAAAGVKLRELLYNAFYVTDHTTHFYVLAGPDFVVGPTADPAERNILGVIHKVGLETGGQPSSSCAPRRRAHLDARRQADPPGLRPAGRRLQGAQRRGARPRRRRSRPA
jgi:F420-non-reducing hydrogenase large subunit